MYDLVVIGAGPAGLTAALYARRAEKTVLVIEKETFGGQITHSPRVENYPGFLSMSGNEFAEKLLSQVMEQGAEIELDTVTGITGTAGDFTVAGRSATYKAKTVVIASGAKHRLLGIPRETEFTGEGISYCAVCDGAFYKDKNVAVIGGGNSALQDAVLLSETAKSVTVIQNLAFLTGEKSLVRILEGRNNVSFIYSTVVTGVVADEKFRGIRVKNEESGVETEMGFDGIFVAIGQQPENEPFRSAVKLNEYGYIEAGEDCLPEAERGIFVAGDCRAKRVRQVTTATADGAVAALAACRLIDELG